MEEELEGKASEEELGEDETPPELGEERDEQELDPKEEEEEEEADSYELLLTEDDKLDDKDKESELFKELLLLLPQVSTVLQT